MPSSEAKRAASAKWRLANQEKYRAQSREAKRLARLDPDKRKAANASSVKSITKRRAKDPMFAFKEKVKTLLLMSIRAGGWSKETKTQAMLGCSYTELIAHLQSKFQEGMTLENHGLWHIDHIVPCASATTKEEFLALQHYTNLQPLWAADNLKKGASRESIGYNFADL